MLHTQLEIAAPPAKVRETLLDFKRIQEWHSGCVQSIVQQGEGPASLDPGNRLRCKISDFEFEPTITKNDESAFEWRGPPVFYILSGLHTFRFEPSKENPGSTTLVHSEEFFGAGKFLMAKWLLGGNIERQYAQFNEDLKAEVEKL
ncbi:MAG: hypothetical protein Q9160_005684 [Pyrenula sp. 1 TL-2023]